MLNLLRKSSFRKTTSATTIFFMALFSSVSAYADSITENHGGLFQPTVPNAPYTTSIAQNDGDSATITNNTTANGINIAANGISTTNGALSFINMAGDVNVTGAIFTQTGDLDFINRSGAGTTTANINLGSNDSSSVLLQGGTLVGEIRMGSDAQTITFEGGSLTGDINSNRLGSVIINSTNKTTLNGNIEANNIIINAGKTLSNSNDNTINANITIGAGGTFDFGNGTVEGTINSADGVNHSTLEFSENTTVGVNTSIGNGRAIGTIEAKANVTLDTGNQVQANATEIDSGKSLTVGSDTSLFSNVNIKNNAKLILREGSNLRSDANNSIAQIVNGDGILEVVDNEGQANVEGVIGTADDVNTANVDERIASINLLSNSKLNVEADSTINATKTNLSSGSELVLQANVAVNSDIQSFDTKTAGQGTGTLTIAGAGVELNGDIGSSTRYISKLDIDSAVTQTIGATSDVYTDSIELEVGSTLSLGASNIKSTNGINGEAAQQGTVLLTSDRVLTNDDFQIGNNTSISRLTIDNGVNVSANSGYDIGADNTYVLGSLTLDQGSVGNETKISGTVMINNDGSLTLNSNTLVTGDIFSDADGAGAVNISGTYSSGAAIGTSANSLALVNLASGATLTSSHNLDASTITLNSNAILNINGGTLAGAINGVANGGETINFNSDVTLAAGTTIGADIDDVNIANGSDVTANANISATRVDIGTGTSGSLTVGAGIAVSSAVNIADDATLNLSNASSVTGAINGATTNGDLTHEGAVAVLDNASVTQGSSIGATRKVSTVSLANGSTLNVGNNTLKANEVTLATGSTLNVGNGTFEATIKSSGGDGLGTVALQSSRTIAAGTYLGTADNSLAQLTTATSTTMALNENIYADAVSFGSSSSNTLAASKTITGNVAFENGSTLTLSNGSSVVGNMNGSADNRGSLAIASSAEVTLGGNVGATNSLSTASLAANSTLTTGANTLTTNGEVSLASNSNLVLGTGALSASAVDGTAANLGKVTLNGNNTISTTLGNTNGLDAIDVVFGRTVTISSDMKATKLTVGKAYSTASSDDATSATLSSDADLTGAVEIGVNSTLTTSGTSSVSGTINGAASGTGALSVNNNLTLQSAVGGTNSLATVSVTANNTLTAGANAISATNVRLANGATLSTAAAVNGAIDGTAAGLGNLTITGTTTFGSNSAIGATNGLNTVSVDSGTFTTGSNLKATTVNVGVNSNAALNLGAGKTIEGSVVISNESTLTVNNNSVVTGAIRGETAGEGNLAISANSTFNAGGNIGQTAALASLSMASGSTFNTGTYAVIANNITAGANSTLNFGQTTVTGNLTASDATVNFGAHNNVLVGNLASNTGSVLNLSTGSHNVDGTLSITGDSIVNFTIDSENYGALIVDGAATVAAGTSVGVTMDSRLAYENKGSSYNLITSTNGAGMVAVDDALIDVNSLGSNKVGLLTFTSSVADNKLTMTIETASASEVSNHGSVQAAYNTINEIGGNANGNLETVQNYIMTNLTTTAGERQAVLESITQNDVGLNQALFAGLSSSINVIENRMSNLSLAAPSYRVTDSRGNKVKGLDKSATALSGGYGSDSSSDAAMGRSVWGQVLGTNAKQSNADGFNGYDAKTRGLAFGIDQQIEKDLLVGVALNINNTDITSASNSGAKRVNVDSYQLTLYGEKKYDDYFVDGFVAGALNRFQSDRQIALVGKIASANYDGYSYSAKTRVGKINRLENGFDVIPHMGLLYGYNSSTNYQESGAGSLDLSVNSKSSEMLIADIGVAVSYDADFFQYKLRPEFKVAYAHDFIGNEQVSSANFVGQGALLNISNSRSDRNIFRAGLGADIYSVDQFTLNASYLLEKRATYQSHTGILKAKYSF